MKHRAAQRKLLLYHHLNNLSTNTLAKQVADTQEYLGFPGLIKECTALLNRDVLPNPNLLSKGRWTNEVKKAITSANRTDLLDKIVNYKKLDFVDISNEKKWSEKLH